MYTNLGANLPPKGFSEMVPWSTIALCPGACRSNQTLFTYCFSSGHYGCGSSSSIIAHNVLLHRRHEVIKKIKRISFLLLLSGPSKTFQIKTCYLQQSSRIFFHYYKYTLRKTLGYLFNSWVHVMILLRFFQTNIIPRVLVQPPRLCHSVLCAHSHSCHAVSNIMERLLILLIIQFKVKWMVI